MKVGFLILSLIVLIFPLGLSSLVLATVIKGRPISLGHRSTLIVSETKVVKFKYTNKNYEPNHILGCVSYPENVIPVCFHSIHALLLSGIHHIIYHEE